MGISTANRGVFNSSTTIAQNSHHGDSRVRAWRGAGSATLSGDPQDRLRAEARAAIRLEKHKEKRDALAERSRARRRRASGLPPAPLAAAPERAGRRARFVEQVEAAERLHRPTEVRSPPAEANSSREQDPLKEAFKDLAQADLQNKGGFGNSSVSFRFVVLNANFLPFLQYCPVCCLEGSTWKSLHGSNRRFEQ